MITRYAVVCVTDSGAFVRIAFEIEDNSGTLGEGAVQQVAESIAKAIFPPEMVNSCWVEQA